MYILKVFIFSLGLLIPTYVCAESDDHMPEEVIVHEVEKNIQQMPTCNDPKLLKKTKEYIDNYYQKFSSNDMKSRRRRYFIQHKLGEFVKEDISNYRTEDKRPVSDIIISLKMNKGLIEENMLLCKSESPYIAPEKIYLLVHPEAYSGYTVHVINLETMHDVIDKDTLYQNTFTYK